MFNKYILGGLEPGFFMAALVFAFFGVLVVLLAGTRLRNPDSKTSPEKFSFKYLMSDNAKRIYVNIICILATLRFATEISGLELTMFRAFSIGLAWDIIFLIVKQKTSWLDPKPKT